ncbi:MAG: NADP-dependent oxidoreductase [Acidobacteriaceae bacterium]|nr:NADP-dependent oxidoreductase [Acidobacteriaceae bacterium]MBV9678512.1 NADP-dependent oxidoreductase [Acidobacteriaceae bacterium]
MKAVVIHEYGDPEVLTFEETPDPVPGAGEVLVRVSATSINPIDILRRSGAAKDLFPVMFPGILGVDLSGTVLELGSGVEGFSIGDPVFGIADRTYAEFCVVKAAHLARIPDGLNVVEAAALPLVTTTGHQLISVGAEVQAGQTVLVTGTVGNVGRSAAFTAKDRGATVIAAVLTKQLEPAASLGVDHVVATDDDQAIANLPPLDAVADTVNGKTAEKLLSAVKKGGVFASVLGVPQNSKDDSDIKVVPVYSQPDTKILQYMAQAVKNGRLVIPIGAKLPLEEAAQGHTAVAKGGMGKVLLVRQ